MPTLAPSPERVARFESDVGALCGASHKLGLAVSGGPDSLALLLLAAAAFPGRVAAATVDHGLRAESSAEAAMVTKLCDDLGVPHAVLPVEVERKASLQQAAREARYRALAAWMTDVGLSVLATAHHVEDQAETLIMRLLRASGVGGLASIRAATTVPGSKAQLIRPLLGWRRGELQAVVDAAGLQAADDASNRNARFDRVRIRNLLETADWLEPEPLARSAAALADADDALVWVTARLWAERITIEGSEHHLQPDGLPSELKRRLVGEVLKHCAPDARRPRGEEVGRLIRELEIGRTATLAGVICRGGATWHFSRETERRKG